MDNTNFSDNLGTLFADVQELVRTDTVLGQPLSVGEKTLVPVMAVTVGYGSTGMGTRVQNDAMKGSSNGLGLGARVSTSAVVVIENDNVTMLPVNEKSNMAQLMEKIPQALTGMGQNMMGHGMGMNQGQNGSQQSQSENSQQSS